MKTLRTIIKSLSMLGVLLISCLLLCQCSLWSHHSKDGPPKHHFNPRYIHNAHVRPVHRSRFGNPKHYLINGRTYHVLPSATGYDQVGIASWYGKQFENHLTSTHERYHMLGMTAAHRRLPLPTFVRVTNLGNGKQVIVKVNDRGPFNPHRIIDLSYAAAKKLGFAKRGTARVRVTALTPHHAHWHWPTLFSSSKKPNPISSHRPKKITQLGAYHSLRNAQRAQVTAQAHWQRPVIVRKDHNSPPLYHVILD